MGKQVNSFEESNGEYYTAIIMIFIIITFILFIAAGFIFRIDYGQPQPTSELITTNITIPLDLDTVGIAFYPGTTVKIRDNNNRGYYYLEWFQPMMYAGHSYEIQYYFDKNGNRRIYKYKDLSEPATDIAKCVTINGVCQ